MEPKQLTQTHRVNKVMEMAAEYARGMGHDYLDTEHVLVGLLMEGGGMASDILGKCKVSLSKVQKAVKRGIAARSGTHNPTCKCDCTSEKKGEKNANKKS